LAYHNAAKLRSHAMELPQNAAIKFSAMYAYFWLRLYLNSSWQLWTSNAWLHRTIQYLSAKKLLLLKKLVLWL